MKISLQIFWKNSAPPVMKKSLASEITSGRGQTHYVFLTLVPLDTLDDV